jgi:hypothetical protein
MTWRNSPLQLKPSKGSRKTNSRKLQPDSSGFCRRSPQHSGGPAEDGDPGRPYRQTPAVSNKKLKKLVQRNERRPETLTLSKQ